MRRFFNSEDPLWKPLGYFAEILLLSLMWFVCSVPVLTLGAASTALYDAIVHSVRNREDDIFSRFFRTFKNELKLSVPCALIWAVVILCLFLWYRIFAYNAGTSPTAYVLSIALLSAQIFVLGMALWVFPILSRFTFDFAALNITALKLSLSHPLRTAASGLLMAVSGWLCIKYIVPVTLLPALVMLLRSYLLEPVFRKLIEDEK